MSDTRTAIEAALRSLELPDGGDLISRDMVRALSVEGGTARFVIEAPSPEIARHMEPLRAAAERAALSVPGITSASVALTAHAPAAKAPPAPSLKLGGHPKGGDSSIRPANVRSILAIGSGKGGVGKSTVASQLAHTLASDGYAVGLLDVDLCGPSAPRMVLGEHATSQTISRSTR